MSQSRILIVEDEPLVRRAYERILGTDHEVVGVGSMREAVAVLETQELSAIVSDLDLPDGSGIDLLKAARRRDADIAFVVVTGYPSVDSAQDAVNFGAFRYLTKPVDGATLRDAVGRAARLSRLARLQRGVAESIAPPRREPSELEQRFEAALDGLWVAFQPIVGWGRRRALGYEALVRSDERSLGNPALLIGAAERLGRLGDLGRTVRQRVAAAMPSLPDDAMAFINLHAADLDDPELADPRSPLAPHADRVVLEITERASLDSVENVSSNVAALRAMGYRLAIDDLGAGYAGLTSVTHLEPEVVKLDMSLVRGVDENTTKQHLIRSFVNVCSELGMMVVTEGVETALERDTLVGLGCDVFQGYLFGRPARTIEAPVF